MALIFYISGCSECGHGGKLLILAMHLVQVLRFSALRQFSSLFFFKIARHCPGQSNWISKRHNVDISCFIHLVQVRKITFAGSTAVGKKFMAGAAGTVKRVCIGC